MLQKGSVIKCADNTGAKNFNLIQVLGGKKKTHISVGDIVVASVRGANTQGTLKDHTVVKVLIVRTVKEIYRRDGTSIRASDNAAVVIDKAGLPKATRIFGPVFREIRDLGYSKIISLAKEVW